MAKNPQKVFIVTTDIVVIAKTEQEARDVVERQLGFSAYGEYSYPVVEQYDLDTKVVSVRIKS